MMIALASAMKRLRADVSGVAMTEFALALPFVLGVGLMGLETANRALVQMQISQLAMQIADNASRIGDQSVLQNRRIYEEQINDLLRGAHLQGGSHLGLYDHGRVLISSLEVWQPSVHKAPLSHAPGTQFISWQRCEGTLERDSLYGVQNSALPAGIGPDGLEVTATTDTPVIYVEVFYDYQPIIELDLFSDEQIYASAAFVVRDSRDQSEVYKRNSITSRRQCRVFDDGAETLP